MDIVDQIVAWENGIMSSDDEIRFFSKLVKNGMAWTLQGMYGRRASDLINEGYLDAQGNILVALKEKEEEE